MEVLLMIFVLLLVAMNIHTTRKMKITVIHKHKYPKVKKVKNKEPRIVKRSD